MNDTECRQSINRILADDSNPLNRKYASTIKQFVNYMCDVIGEAENISYADKIVKISQILGKDRILKATHLNESKESAQMSLANILNSDDKSNESFKVLLRYYVNHQDQLDGDKSEINDNSDIKKSIKDNYKKVYDEECDDAFDGLSKMVKDAAQIDD